MQVSPSTHQIPVTTPTLWPSTTTNVYIVTSQDECVFIDAGYDDPTAAQAIIDCWQQIGSPVPKGILLTHHHRDHAPGARFLAERLGAPVMCHSLDQQEINDHIAPVAVTRNIDEGTIIEVGTLQLQILHTPGHTRGHVSVWNASERLLFSGDNVLGEGTTWIGPPDGDLIDYLTTLNRLRDLKAERIAPGHGPMVENPSEQISFVVERRLLRERQIVDLLNHKERTADEIVTEIYKGQIPDILYGVAERTVVGHLEKLIRDGKVVADNQSGSIVYQLASRRLSY